MNCKDCLCFEVCAIKGRHFAAHNFVHGKDVDRKHIEDVENICKHFKSKQKVEAKWVYIDGDLGYGDYQCTNCNEIVCIDDFQENYKFCPNCGAEMRGEEK